MRGYGKNQNGSDLVYYYLTCVQTVFAHHLWVSKQDDLYAVCRGLMAERLDAYEPSKLLKSKPLEKMDRHYPFKGRVKIMVHFLRLTRILL
jgi:hypothetical protein